MGRPRTFDTEDVLARAMDTFWAHGYEATGVQALCQATGLQAGSLYSAFGDKRGLFIAALKQYMAVVSSEAIDRLNRNPSGLAAIRDYFQALVAAMVDGKRQWGCLVTNSVVEFALRDAEIAEAFRVHLARVEAAFAGALERARHAGEVPQDLSAAQAALFLSCTVQGLNVLAKTRPGRPVLESVVASALRSLHAPAATTGTIRPRGRPAART
jgi:TetR/AcrR family transcriptional regulator, transcriptional repressor for nem operon